MDGLRAERLANIKFDESKFSTQKEFLQYIREFMLTKDTIKSRWQRYNKKRLPWCKTTTA